MESRQIDKRIDEVAEAAKRVVAKVDETRRTASDLADAALNDAQTAITQASRKGEHRLSERVTQAAHRIQETVTKLAHRAEEWADRATARGDAAARSRPDARKPSADDK